MIFILNVVERLFMIPKTIFKCCFTWAKVTFLFIPSDVTVNYSQCWLDKLCMSFDNYFVEGKYLYYGSFSY